MTYEQRLKHRELLDRTARLREGLEEADASPMTRGEAREVLEIIEEILTQLSPERWDRLMETVVEEAQRRSGAAAAIR